MFGYIKGNNAFAIYMYEISTLGITGLSKFNKKGIGYCYKLNFGHKYSILAVGITACCLSVMHAEHLLITCAYQMGSNLSHD